MYTEIQSGFQKIPADTEMYDTITSRMSQLKAS